MGLGPVENPLAAWETIEPTLIIDAVQLAALQASHPGKELWVRQVGSHAQSDPLSLGIIP